jgi:hypothetical protein
MSLRPRDRFALIALICLVLVGAYYELALKPEQNKAKALDSAIAAQRQTLAKEQQDYALGRAAQAALHANAAEWTSIRLAVPVESDIPALLRTLQRTADTVHVKMSAINLTGSSSGATQSGAVGSATGASSPGTATGVPIQLTFAGGYVALDNLVRRLDDYVVVSADTVRATGPLVSISSVQISGAPNLQAQLSATIYQLPTASAPAGAATTTIGSQ